MKNILIAMLASVLLVLASPAQAAGPVVKPILTGPISVDKYAYSYAAEANRAIRGTPKGETIRVVMFLLDTGDTIDSLIAAHRRGVNVKVVVDRHQGETTLVTNLQVAKLVKAFGTNKKARSFVYRPIASGFSRKDNTQMHAKAISFSRTIVHGKSVRYRSFLGSANLSFTNTQGSYNETMQVDDKIIYNGVTRFFNAIVADKDNAKAYHKATSGSFTAHFYPGGPNVNLDRLNAIKSCKNVRIRVSSFIWTNGRVKDAEKLRSLASKGCKVQVIGNFNTKEQLFGTKISKTLIGAKNVEVRNGRKPNLGYSHLKLMMIETPTWTRVLGGSTNFTANAQARNAEIMTESSSRAVYDQYDTYFDKYWAWSVRMTKQPTSAPQALNRALETDKA